MQHLPCFKNVIVSLSAELASLCYVTNTINLISLQNILEAFKFFFYCGFYLEKFDANSVAEPEMIVTECVLSELVRSQCQMESPYPMRMHKRYSEPSRSSCR